MRVLIFSQYFWPETFSINELVKGLIEKGMDVDVLTGKPNYPEGSIYADYRAWGCQTEGWQGATVYRIPLAPRGARNALRLAINYLSFILSGLVFAPWLLRRRNYRIIFVYAPSPILQAIPALFLGWLKGCPVVVWVQDLWPDTLESTGYIRNPHLIRLVGLVVRFIYRHTDLLMVPSKAFVKWVAALARHQRIEYYPNSVDPVFASPPEVALPEVPGLTEGFSVLFAGNVGTLQAVHVIVEAATLLKDYPDVRFVVMGQGSRWEWMRQQVEARGLTNLYLPGRFPVEAMPGIMQKASVLLVTLLNQPIFAATVPNKVQAYMAAGKPIVACVNGEGARLVIEADAGLAAPAEDASALADAVLSLYRMTPQERERLGANGRRYYEEQFNHDMLVEKLIQRFRAVSESAERSR